MTIHAGIPQMTVGAVAHLGESVGQRLHLHVGHDICPKGHLGTVERRLLDDRHLAYGVLNLGGHEHRRLIAGIAQEIAAEDAVGTRQLVAQQKEIGGAHALELLFESEGGIADMNHGKALGDIGALTEEAAFYTGLSVGDMLNAHFLHLLSFIFVGWNPA